MNLFRVVTIAVAQTEFDTDLSHGWQHDLVGYAGIIGALIFLLSTDRLLFFFLSGIPDDAGKNETVNVFVSTWNRIFVSSTVIESEKRSLDQKQNRLTKPQSNQHLWFAIVMLIACLLTGLPSYGKWSANFGSTKHFNQSLDLTSVTSSWLDIDHLDGCQLLNFETEQRDVSSQFGEYSNKWTVTDDSRNILHSLDHSFDGWHNLTICYRSIGWRMEKMVHRDHETSGENWPVVYAEFVKPSGEHAYLCFSLFTTAGEFVAPEGEAGITQGLTARLRQLRLDTQQTVQIQTLTSSLVALDQSTLDKLVEDHLTVRTELRKRIQSLAVTSDNTQNGAGEDLGGPQQ